MSAPRKIFTTEQKLALVEKYKASGMNVNQFCAANANKCPHTSALRQWIKGKGLGLPGTMTHAPTRDKKRRTKKAKAPPPIVMRKFSSTVDGELAIQLLEKAALAQDIGVMRAIVAAARHLLDAIIL